MSEKKTLTAAIGMLAMFVLWTMLIRNADVQPIGPEGSQVGLAGLNGWFHALTGVNWTLYTITDWLGLVPILVCACYGVLGAAQWIRRRRLLRVDTDILLLGIYYLLVIFGYLFFEMIPVNYRPVLIDGYLEASYPSSTTLLVLSVMPTLKFQTVRRCGNGKIRQAITMFAALFSAFMAIGRLISGVHWLTDIIGSVLLSGGLYLFYRAAVAQVDRKKAEETEDGVS